MKIEQKFHSNIYEALSRHGAAFCIYDLAGQQSPKGEIDARMESEKHALEEALGSSFDEKSGGLEDSTIG